MAKELADVDCLLRFPKKPGAKSIAIAKDGDDLVNEPIFLPTSEIEVFDTGRKEAGKPIITVTMPQWLAEAKELV
ncbi:MAG: hypothetical protein EOQ44_25520 [Mesorhizobium sp.]|uniref:hypothetical protein n=1 Tax=unclassified Mesorhizobium TaxID=325217 RepID=UPI000F75E71D|nr:MULTISPECIES: hypothetical protein [unclassified Mesorhizobium]AZO48017.1 hypothetical protein EJ073_09450 [Mesorhizobium sp. M4B.F.Ca.ET.058.02.1.1]RWB40500.1 MAG: hypothetical protein EOQ44_25520 [Mesorhizobium sp.]